MTFPGAVAAAVPRSLRGRCADWRVDRARCSSRHLSAWRRFHVAQVAGFAFRPPKPTRFRNDLYGGLGGLRVQPRAGWIHYGALHGVAHDERQALRDCTPRSRSRNDLPRKCGAFSQAKSRGVQLGQVAIYCRVSTDDQSCERQDRKGTCARSPTPFYCAVASPRFHATKPTSIAQSRGIRGSGA